jgi:hypothetical protein
MHRFCFGTPSVVERVCCSSINAVTTAAPAQAPQDEGQRRALEKLATTRLHGDSRRVTQVGVHALRNAGPQSAPHLGGEV